MNKTVLIFNKTVLNTICSFIPHETVTFESKNPNGITSHIKKAVDDKNLTFKRFVRNNVSVNNHSNLEKLSFPENILE